MTVEQPVQLLASLAGTVCLVTGASRGIGRATALRLAAAGATVTGTYRSQEAAARELAEAGAGLLGTVEMMRCDITDPQAVSATVSAILERHGSVGALVNNAGVWRGGRLVTLDERDWQLVLDTDVAAVFRVTQAVLPSMLQAGRGAIVNVSSIVGMMAYPGDTAYASAKAAVNAFTRSLAKEVARSGVTVNAVAPGSLDTDMTRQLDERARERFLARIPMGRQGTPEEVAETIAFLVGAPAYLTGAVIPVAGGLE